MYKFQTRATEDHFTVASFDGRSYDRKRAGLSS